MDKEIHAIDRETLDKLADYLENQEEVIPIAKYKIDTKFITSCSFCEADLVYSIGNTIIGRSEDIHGIYCPICGTFVYIHRLVPAMQTSDGTWCSVERNVSKDLPNDF